MSQERIATVVFSAIESGGNRVVPLTAGETLHQRLRQSGDLDVAVDRPLPALLTEHRPVLESAGIVPLLWSQYDIGRGDAVWLWDTTDATTLQLDVLCDPKGTGRLGVPTTALLDAAGSTGTDGWRCAYFVSKRLQKRQWSRLATLASRCSHDADEPLREVFGPQAGMVAGDLLRRGAGEAQWRSSATALRRGRTGRRWRRNGGPVRLTVERLRRFVRRATTPVGFWAHLAGEGAQAAAEAVADTLGAALPRQEVRRVSGPSVAATLQLRWTLLRPSLVVTYSSTGEPLGARPHARVATGSTQDPVAAVATAMAARSWRTACDAA